MILSVDVLQLIMGAVNKPDEDVSIQRFCNKTPAYKRHTEDLKFLNKKLSQLSSSLWI